MKQVADRFVIDVWKSKNGTIRCVKRYWKIIADNLGKAGWSWRRVSTVDCERGRTIWIADAHRGNGQRLVVRPDEKLTAFLELERGICIHLLTVGARQSGLLT